MPDTLPDKTPPPPPRRARWVRRRELPLPTWRLWLVLIVAAAGLLRLVAEKAHSLLCESDPVEDAEFLAVEGWVPDYAVQEARDFATTHGVQQVFTTGCPMEAGVFLSELGTYADLAAASLTAMGTGGVKVEAVPAPEVKMERTRASARALREHLDKLEIPADGRRINLLTLGTHARRSVRIFREELGEEWSVGVISVTNAAYPPDRWWTRSSGVKSVIEEWIALAVQRE